MPITFSEHFNIGTVSDWEEQHRESDVGVSDEEEVIMKVRFGMNIEGVN